MKNDEFKKLDAFMEKHGPELKAAPVKSRMTFPLTRHFFIYATAMGMAGIVSWSVIKKHSYDSGSKAASEIMLWDVTTDEMPVDLEETLSEVEGSSDH